MFAIPFLEVVLRLGRKGIRRKAFICDGYTLEWGPSGDTKPVQTRCLLADPADLTGWVPGSGKKGGLGHHRRTSSFAAMMVAFAGMMGGADIEKVPEEEEGKPPWPSSSSEVAALDECPLGPHRQALNMTHRSPQIDHNFESSPMNHFKLISGDSAIARKIMATFLNSCKESGRVLSSLLTFDSMCI